MQTNFVMYGGASVFLIAVCHTRESENVGSRKFIKDEKKERTCLCQHFPAAENGETALWSEAFQFF